MRINCSHIAFGTLVEIVNPEDMFLKGCSRAGRDSSRGKDGLAPYLDVKEMNHGYEYGLRITIAGLA